EEGTVLPALLPDEFFTADLDPLTHLGMEVCFTWDLLLVHCASPSLPDRQGNGGQDEPVTEESFVLGSGQARGRRRSRTVIHGRVGLCQRGSSPQPYCAVGPCGGQQVAAGRERHGVNPGFMA